MRILSITAGAADMYCGSCLRDNALAAELLRRGHDVTLLPLYTPTRTDEPNVSQPRVFFGGVSVYLQQHVPLFRRTPRLLDRLWDHPAVIRAVSRRGIRTEPRDLGELTVSMLHGEQGHQAKELEKLLAWLRREPPYDVVVLPNALLIGLATPVARATSRPVICTLQGEDLFLEGLSDAARAEALALIRRHAPAVTRFVAVSEYYADFMATYLGIARSRIEVVSLGIATEGYRPRAAPPDRPHTIGYLARIDAAKGLERLCRVYVHMRRALGLPPSRLAAAGYLGPAHRAYLKACEQILRDSDLHGEFHYAGELDRRQKIDFLCELDAFSVPTVYVEPKGLFVLEAMACGVPVVQPAHGAFPELLTRTGGGLLVDGGEVELAEALMSLWRDPVRAARIGRQGAAGVRAYYSVERMANRAVEVYAAAATAAPPADRAAAAV
jgi:glycosyltransferase involved in cell wall biosynthesis